MTVYKKSFIKPKLPIFILALLTYSGCTDERGRITLSSDTTKVKDEILKQIPLGSPIEQAQKIMQDNDFQCAMKLNESFVEMEAHQTKAIHKGIEYLYCDKEVGMNFYCNQRWQIAIVQRDKVVINVLISYGTICL